MRASSLEFRLRVFIITLIIILGFWAPWIQALDLGKRISLLEWLALQLSRIGLLRFTYATPVVIVIGALLAAIGMVLRIAGSAYLGCGTVLSPQLQGQSLTFSGPYRYVRNPLYLGSWFVFAAVSFLMPPSGALFVMLLVTIFFLRLILAEESFLSPKLGEPYRDYLHNVPRILPRLRTTLPRTNAQPQWLGAASTELFPIGAFITLAGLAWTYDNLLMIKAIIVSFGISLVTRALAMGKAGPAEPNHDPA